MARAPYRPVELDVALKPVAAPVDTFVRAQEPSRDDSLQDLARSLSGLGGSLAGLVGQRDKEAEEADKVRGEAAFWQSNGLGAADAVAQGLIPAQASPAFMQSYKRAQGEAAGGTLEQKFSAAYDGWEGKTSADPKAFDGFLGGFLKENVTTQDPDILRGLLPKVRQLSANYLQRHIGEASRATMDGYVNVLAVKGDQALDAADSAGLASKTGTDYAAVFSILEAIRAEGLKAGANEAKVDEKLIDTVTASAITKRDPKILDFLERKVPGKDYAWSNTPYGRDQKQKTIDTLEAMGRRSIGDTEKKRREELAAARDDITRRTIQAITANPSAPLPEDLLAAGEKVDPDFRVNAIRWRDTIGKQGQTSDPQDIFNVTRAIIEGGGMRAVQRGIDAGVFKNAEDLTRAYKLAESMAKDGPALDGIMKGGTAKTILDTIKKRTANALDASKYFDDGSVSPEGLQAQTDFRLAILAWREANPQAGPIDQEKAVAEIGAGILKRIEQPGGPLTQIEYDRRGIPGANTFGSAEAVRQMPAEAGGAAKPPPSRPVPAAPPAMAPEPAPTTDPLGNPTGGAAPTAPAPSPAPAASAPKVEKADSPAEWFEQQPPETKAFLEALAAREKKPLQLKLQEVFDSGVKKGLIAPPASASVPTPALRREVVPPASPPPAPEAGPAALGPSPEMRSQEQTYSRPGAKRPPGAWLRDPFGSILSNRPRAPWWPEKGKTGGEAEEDDRSSMMRAPDGTPIAVASASTEQDVAPPEADVSAIGEAFERALSGSARPVGGYSSARLRDDPKAARILDFVAGPESGGNYNAYFANAGSKRDLSTMTLDQVVAWSGNRGTKSSATGRYQFMRKTLLGLKQEMGLTGAEPFSPELQDRMALQLLERRGYSAWQAGRITDAQFANRLALEWAALPNITPQNGRPAGVSAYAGDGLNRSGVSPAAVMAALRGREGSGFLGRLMGRSRLKAGSRPGDDETRI